MAKPTMISFLRNILQDTGDPATYIWQDSDIVQALKRYLIIYKKQPMQSLDGLWQRFDSTNPYWMDGVMQYMSDDESVIVYFAATIYTTQNQIIADPATYITLPDEGAIIFNDVQPDFTFVFGTYYYTNPYHAAADLLDELATKKSRTSLGVQLGSLSVNLSKLPGDLRAMADRLRGEGGPIVGVTNRSDKLPRRNKPSDFRWNP